MIDEMGYRGTYVKQARLIPESLCILRWRETVLAHRQE